MDLSSFYFDIRKDVLYCDDLKSKKRIQCTTVLNIILECLLKLFAPIFVFTTEEIYNLVNKKEESIHESTFAIIPKYWKNEKLNKKWKELFSLKQEVNLAIEEKRSNKEIGSSLEAEMEIYTNSENFNLMEGLDLAEYFITSKATKVENTDKNEKTKIIIKKAKGNKCSRCWKIVDNICQRCKKIESSSN